MPGPSKSLATLRPDLGGSLMEFDLAMDREGFISYKLLPVLEVRKQAGVFGRVTLKSLLQSRETKRAPRGGYSRGNWEFEDDSFACVEHGAEEPIDDREAAMYAEYFHAEQVSAQRAFDAVLRNAEQRGVDLLTDSAVWTGVFDDTVGTPWDDFANATPIDDVNAAAVKIWARTGKWPNCVALERRDFRNLRQCQQIIDRIASSGAGGSTVPTQITVNQIAECFDVPMVYVAGSAKNTANEGQAVSIDSVWPSGVAGVYRIATSNDIREPCVGRVFHWAEDGSAIGGTVETYRDETIRGDVARVRHDVHEKRLYLGMGNVLRGLKTT